MLFFCRTGCGREPLAVYANEFYSNLEIAYNSRDTTLLQGFVDFMVSILATFAVGRFKRRTLLFFVVFMLVPSVCVLIVSHIFRDHVNEFVPWLVPCFAIVYTSACTAFLFPLVTIVAVEVVARSNEYRNSIYTIAYTLMSLSRALFTAVFPLLIHSFDINVILAIFLFSNLLLLFWVKLFVNETADKALHACLPPADNHDQSGEGKENGPPQKEV